MSKRDELNLAEGEVVASPILENEKFVVGSERREDTGPRELHCFRAVSQFRIAANLFSRVLSASTGTTS